MTNILQYLTHSLRAIIVNITGHYEKEKLSRPSVRFEFFTAVAIKNDVFWDVTACGSCKNRRFGGTWRLLHQGDKNR
jgi:hypothetical protein